MNISVLDISNKKSFYETDQADTLLVLLHAYNRKPKSLQNVADIARKSYPKSDVFVPNLPLGTFSFADPEMVAKQILSQIDELQTRSYERIVFVGHSMGAMLARKICALSYGATVSGEIDVSSAKPWAKKIERLVLIAAVSRGWTLTSALSPVTRIAWAVGAGIGNFCRFVFRRDMVILGVQRGAPFITLLRLQSLALEQTIPPHNLPITIQLLGTSDDLVAPADHVDFASGRSFYYIEVADATHMGIVDLHDGKAQHAFRKAIAGNLTEVEEVAIPIDEVFDLYHGNIDDYDAGLTPKVDESVTDVVFVIHGIRDRGFWTHRIAREIKREAGSKKLECRTITSTYGYFGMGPFIVPWVRRNKVNWLLDQYVTAKSYYPKACFSFIGHSNGTYLLTKAMDLCEAIKMKRILFAGSVVRTDYRWNKLIPDRVQKVVNYVATEDWVVAVFPNGLQNLGQDVGGAGHHGFQTPTNSSSTEDDHPDVINIRHVQGAHGAALRPRRWQEIAAFIISGTVPISPKPPLPQKGWARLLGKTATWWCAAAAATILAPLIAILLQFEASGLQWGIMLILYLVFTAIILTRF